MRENDYTVTIPYSDFKKFQKIKADKERLEEQIISCFNPAEGDIVNVDVTKLMNIGKTLLPSRYQENNYVRV